MSAIKDPNNIGNSSGPCSSSTRLRLPGYSGDMQEIACMAHRFLLGSQDLPGKPEAYNNGLRSINYGLQWPMILGYLAFQVERLGEPTEADQ